MNRENLRITTSRFLQDRGMVILAVIMLLTCVVYCIVTGVNIHASDVTVYVRYTAFGEAHFYKAPWQYLLLFVLFGLVVVAAHIAVMTRLLVLERRQTALFVGWVGIVVLGIALAYTLSVISLGAAV